MGGAEGLDGDPRPGARERAEDGSRTSMSEADPFAAQQLELHGHRVIYRTAGSGPPVVLIHGMVNSSRHWQDVALRLAGSHRVVAPDLIGHGDSAAVRGDYSLGAHAASIRDLLAVLGINRATIVGHSLGGGIAMQFFYQFPQRTERLVLISSGGLGHDVSPMLRGAAMPGASAMLWAAAHPRLLAALERGGEWARERGYRKLAYLKAVARALRPLGTPGAREAFLQTLRAVIDARGQRVSARDRLYLLGPMPTLIVWGERDHTIPLDHGRSAHEEIPNSRFETLPRAAHFPNIEDPAGLAAVLTDFLETTDPLHIDDGGWGDIVTGSARGWRRPTRVAG